MASEPLLTPVEGLSRQIGYDITAVRTHGQRLTEALQRLDKNLAALEADGVAVTPHFPPAVQAAWDALSCPTDGTGR